MRQPFFIKACSPEGRRTLLKKELAHFTIGDSYGGSQDWFREPMMKLGG
jgi:hypothetical protein